MIIEALLFLLFAYSFFKAYRRRKCSPDYLGKTVWITGASSGLGEYLAYEFNRLGAEIIISARNLSELQRVKEKCYNPANVTILRMDMTDYDTVREITHNIIENLQKQNKKLDVVVENAGVSMRCQFKEYAFKNHLQLFDVNVNGPYYHIQCFIEHMMKHKSGQIVGISSVAGKLSTAYRSSYAGSKHALIGILDSLRTQFHPYGISVTNIMPGYVKTNISKNAFSAGQGQKFEVTDKNIQKGIEPDVFARQAVQAIFMKEKQLQISGRWIIPIGIFMRGVLPDLAFLGLRDNAKNQSKAIVEGKKEN